MLCQLVNIVLLSGSSICATWPPLLWSSEYILLFTQDSNRSTMILSTSLGDNSIPLLTTHNVQIYEPSESTGYLLLSHGFGTNQSAWQSLLPHFLLLRYKVIVYDLMGAGTTFHNFDTSRYSSLEGFADDLICILQELNIKSCVFVGHSMSCMIGCIASIRHPELFEKLVLIAGSPRYLNDKDYFGGFELKDIEQIICAIGNDFNSWVEGFVPLVLDCKSPKIIHECIRMFLEMRPEIALCIGKAIFFSDYRGILPQVKVPCHLIHSSKDIAVPTDVYKYMHQNLGGEVSLHVLNTEGHLPHITSVGNIAPVFTRLLARSDI